MLSRILEGRMLLSVTKYLPATEVLARACGSVLSPGSSSSISPPYDPPPPLHSLKPASVKPL